MCFRTSKAVSALAGAALISGLGSAYGGPQDVLVQPPSIGQPQRGNIAGSLSKLAFGPADLSRGAYSLPLAIDAPGERGALQAQPFPSYSAENGLSEWGMGWQADLSIRRYRVVGDVGFDNADGYTSPWGRLVRGDDGTWYPAGLRSLVRATEVNGGWLVRTADGTTYTYAAADAVAGSGGTFAWMLTRVDSVVGDSTRLTWIKNSSGRAFLSQIVWGGRADGTQHRARLDYETLPLPFANYTSGLRQELDRRVTRVTLESKSVTSGAYAERWHYDLAYQRSPIGPAFFLTRATKVYASGNAEPSTVYTYDNGSEQFATAQLAHEPGLDTYLGVAGGAALQPDRAAMTDLEQNGLTDLEHYYSLMTVRQNDEGIYAFENLPARTGSENPLCRPQPSLTNKPRLLARMRPDTAEPQVVVLKKEGTGLTTRLIICDRPGNQIYDQVLSGAWELSGNVRLADVDTDRRPDLVRILPGGVQVMRNVGGPSGYQFVPGAISTLSPNLTPTASWVLDFNGDGKPDIMARTTSSVIVWYGTGNGRFESTGRTLQFKRPDGTLLTGMSNYQFSHGDFNNDGLSDVLLSQNQTALVYMNQGDHFLFTSVPGLANINWSFGFPVIADLSGSGNPEVVLAKGNEAWAIDLSLPSAGLLLAADDGKGTVARFGYRRVKPEPGIVHRYSLLDSLTVTSTGRGTVTNRYQYAAPRWHSLGRYLVGFASTTKTSPSLVEQVQFHHDDEVAGIVLSTLNVDESTPGVVQFSRNQFDARQFHGIPWLRQAAAESGWRHADGAAELATRIDYEAYDRDVCPSRTSTTMSDAALIEENTLATVPALAGDLHCLPATMRQIGVHADPTLDFDERWTVDRNAAGQVARVTQLGAQGPLVVQEISYDSLGRPLQVGAPQRGTVQSTYDATGRLIEVVDAQGVRMRVAGFDPITDAMLAITTDRGTGGAASSFFAYDGYERLERSWNDYTGASQASPSQRLSYAWATGAAPGRIVTDVLIDAAANVRAQAADLQAADGSAIATAAYVDDQWIFAGLGQTDLAQQTQRTFRRDPLRGYGSLASADLASLYVGATPVGITRSAGFGHAAVTTRTHQAGVEGTTEVTLALQNGELVTRSTENGQFVRESATDAAGRVVRVRDENGTEHHFAYDAKGRLVQATTPDGRHRVGYDDYGRPEWVEREGVARFEYQYDPVSGLLSGKQVRDAAGNLVRSESASHDSLGRVTAVQHRRAADGAEREVWLSYDGDGADGAGVQPGQKGWLSRVVAEMYERRILHDRGGRVIRTTTVLGNGWRQIREEPTYRADGSVAAMHVTVSGPGGEMFLDTVRATEIDAWGRARRLMIDGRELYTLTYDEDGRVGRADFEGGEAIVFEFDAVTGMRRGYRIEGPVVDGGVSWQRDDRGRTAAETILQDGRANVRSYTYDDAGRLTAANDDTGRATYAYSPSGLPTFVADVAGQRNLQRAGNELTANGKTYRWDAMGRVVQKGDMILEYGPSGQLERASKPNREIRYYYNDADERTLKVVDGTPAMAWFGDAILTPSSIIERVEVEGITVGLIENGQFTLLLTDPRGTPVLDAGGEAYLASPYGVRLEHEDFAGALDYTRLGWDADLETVRMGARDYDPVLSQFWTPDPKFLANVDSCVTSPEQCNLYSYAGGDPINFVDPSGLDRDMPDRVKDENPADVADHNKRNPKEPIALSHPLGNNDVIVTPLDYEELEETAEFLWNQESPGYFTYSEDCWWPGWNCSGKLHWNDTSIPEADMTEIVDHIKGLAYGPGLQQIETKSGFVVRIWVVDPMLGEMVQGQITGNSTAEYVNGYSFTKGYSQTTSWEVNGEVNGEIGKKDVAKGGGKIGGKYGRSTTNSTQETTNKSERTATAAANSMPAVFQAEKALIYIGISKGVNSIWFTAPPADSRQSRAFIMHRNEPRLGTTSKK
jgi:RHS repeat-associated protein